MDVSSAGFRSVTFQSVGPSEAETGKRADRLVSDHAGVIENFLKLDLRGGALLRGQIRFAAQVNGIQTKSESTVRVSQFIRGRGRERVDSPCSIAVPKGYGGMNHGQVIEPHNCIFGEAFAEIAGKAFS